VLAVVLALGAGGGGYLIGHSRSPDLAAARAAGEKAGRAAGTKSGTDRGYARGLEEGARAAYRKAYKKAYKKALSTPTPVKVKRDSTPGTSAD
jgi:hypothetical protein